MARRRVLITVVAALSALAGAAACEPPPPVPVFTVTTTSDGADAHPGDGACDTGSPAGTCTLRAAVEEGNALGRAEVLAHSGVYAIEVEVTGTVTVRPSANAAVHVASAVVRPGGVLGLDGVGVTFLRVEGALLARRLRNFHSTVETAGQLRVAPGGTAVISDSAIAGMGTTPIVVDDGLLHLRRSTVSTYDATAVRLDGASVLDVGSSALLTTGTSGVWGTGSVHPPCAGGTVVSAGSNFASATTTDPDPCRLTGPGDLRGGDPRIDGYVLVQPGSPLIDRVPLGVLGCGDTSTDAFGDPRPVDGDGDGVAACDVGADEAPAAPTPSPGR